MSLGLRVGLVSVVLMTVVVTTYLQFTSVPGPAEAFLKARLDAAAPPGQPSIHDARS